MAANEEIMTIREVASYLRVHHTTLYRLVDAGRLPCFKVGADYRFRRKAIEEWIDAQRKDVAAQRKLTR